MKVIFLDFDGVLNSEQSTVFWHNKRDQEKWENEMYDSWQGTLYEYLAHEFCPIAISNLEELIRRVPDVNIVVSSTWRIHNDVKALKKILAPSKLISDRIIDVTPRLDKNRGYEIDTWLQDNKNVTSYVIIDDDNDMLDEQLYRFVNISSLHGFLYEDMIKAERILKKS